MTRLILPFNNILKLIFKDGEPVIIMRDEVKAWLDKHGHKPFWVMNNPWEAIFDYEDSQQAMLFKLVWG